MGEQSGEISAESGSASLAERRATAGTVYAQAKKWARRHRRVMRWGLAALVVLALAALEMRRSWGQAFVFSRWANALTVQVEPGPSDRVAVPTHGPYNERLGYTHIPALVDSLTARRYRVTAQARPAPAFARTLGLGLYPVYPHKNQAGLQITDRGGRDLFRAAYPAAVYATSDSIPRLVQQTLLLIENRDLLDASAPYKNPAIEWGRLAQAVLLQIWTGGDGPGGSTLATQLAKVRHSPGGRTGSPLEKLQQMTSASLQAYRGGARTVEARREIVREYLNALPLAARPGYGEVNGLLDGLRVWYGADPAQVNARLQPSRTAPDSVGTAPDSMGTASTLQERAVAYRQVLSLILSTRSPSRFFRQPGGHEALDALIDRYLPLMAEAGVISPSLRDAALQVSLSVAEQAPAPPSETFVARKAANAVRGDLIGLTPAASLSELDRYDLTAHTTFDRPVQEDVARVLEQLRDPSFVRQQGLVGARLLAAGDPSKVIYSVVLYETGPTANVLRVQADNFPGPFDVNRQSKLELGSTAKLRTLVTYLELVERVWAEHHAKPAAELRSLAAVDTDPITQWTLAFCARTPSATRRDVLEAAMARTYSSGAGERFFTGGGVHTFRNFSADTSGTMTVRQAFRTSVNLVFIRMMRDIVDYHVARLPGQPADALGRPDDPRRGDYLRRFAEQEGAQFLTRYYRAYRAEAPQGNVLPVFGTRHVLNARRLAYAYRSIFPEANLRAFRDHLRQHATNGASLSDAEAASLYERANPASLSWQDRGYVAGVHPLELWLANYLHARPSAPLRDVLAESHDVRQEVYAWLFRRSKGSQDTRIRTILEQEAFDDIHRMWSRLGYPFERLVPTYATSIGSSADRPAALAELVGILLRDGLRYPSIRIDSLHIAPNTPYETVLERDLLEPERILSPELSQVVRDAMRDVVENGTAVRARGALTGPDGAPLPIGGKTGTGDNRIRVQRSDAASSIALNRTATFVFFAGARLFGAVVAYVPGREAAQYNFTSSLPTSVLRILGPSLSPLAIKPPPEMPPATAPE